MSNPKDESKSCPNPFCRIHGSEHFDPTGNVKEQIEQLLTRLELIGDNVHLTVLSPEQNRRVLESASHTAGELRNDYTDGFKELWAKQEFRSRLFRRFLADSQEWADLFSEPTYPAAMGDTFRQLFEFWCDHFVWTWSALNETSH